MILFLDTFWTLIGIIIFAYFFSSNVKEFRFILFTSLTLYAAMKFFTSF